MSIVYASKKKKNTRAQRRPIYTKIHLRNEDDILIKNNYEDLNELDVYGDSSRDQTQAGTV